MYLYQPLIFDDYIHMKKILITAFLILTAVGVTLMLRDFLSPNSYTRDDFNTAMNSGIVAVGAGLEGEFTYLEPSFPDGVFSRVRIWLDEFRGDIERDEMVEYVIRRETEQVRIMIRFRNEDFQNMQTDPSPNDSKLSSDLEREILKRLPGVKLSP